MSEQQFSHKTTSQQDLLNYVSFFFFFTFSTAETNTSQELIAQHGLPVPHSQLQAHPLQLIQSHILIHKSVGVVGVQVLLHNSSLPLRGLGFSWEQVPAEQQVSLVHLERKA